MARGNIAAFRPLNTDMDWEFFAYLLLGNIILWCGFAILALPTQFILAATGLSLPLWTCTLLVAVISGAVLILVLWWATVSADAPNSQASP